MNIKGIYWRIVPSKLRFLFHDILFTKRRALVKNAIIEEMQLGSEYKKEELEKIKKYVVNHKVSTFNYEFCEKYNNMDIVIEKDKKNKLLYVLHNGKRMYFKRSYTKDLAKKCYINLLMEQDIKSPHCYFGGKKDKIGCFFDCGGAEGIISLDILDYADYIYIFECDDEWIEALQETFADYSDKVKIIKKYVSDVNNEACISMDQFISDNLINTDNIVVKMDIEGAELSALRGMEKTISECKQLRIYMACYHNPNDSENLLNFVQNIAEIDFEYSDGYMVHLWEKEMKTPYFRRGILRITKSKRI